MKRLLLVFMFFILNNSFASTLHSKEEIRAVLDEILTLIQENKESELNKRFVNKDLGIYFIEKIGIAPTFAIHKELEPFDNSKIPEYPFYNTFLGSPTSSAKTLKNEYVSFDCGSEKWEKEGLFYGELGNYPLLSKIIETDELFEQKTYTKEQKDKITFIERNSIRVVDTKLSMVFYITKIDGAWYFSVIDFATDDCSA
ncbi:MAG: hypothetical protein ACK5LP_01600 [Campylobacteraceae bacterium]